MRGLTGRSFPGVVTNMFENLGNVVNSIRFSDFKESYFEDETSVKLSIEMPGVDKNDIKVSVENHAAKGGSPEKILVVSVKQTKASVHKTKESLEEETHVVESCQRYDISEMEDEITSEYKNGVLSISMTKKPIVETPVRNIEIK